MKVPWCLISRDSVYLFKGTLNSKSQEPRKGNYCTSCANTLSSCRHCLLVFVMYISAVLLQFISLFPPHVKMLMFLPALNLKLSVAPSAPIIANYLLQPQAMCRLASSNQTLLISRQGCVVHQNGILIGWIFLAVTVFGSKLWLCVRHEGEMFRCWQVFVKQQDVLIQFLFSCVFITCVCAQAWSCIT